LIDPPNRLAGRDNLNSIKTASSYAAQFACVGADCEDTCCAGWTVPVDQAAFERFQQLPSSPLKVLLEASIELKPMGSPHFAILRMDAQTGCPIQTPSGLCQLHAQHGEEVLSETCRQYPRYKQSINDQTEVALALSCPEAARLVLFHPNLLGIAGNTKPVGASEPPNLHAESPLMAWAGQIRALILWLVASNRQYPLWQRMFLLSIFCHRLDALKAGHTEDRIPALLAGFQSTVTAGSLRPAFEVLEANGESQMDVVLQLAGILLHQSNVRPRFVECVQAFTAGIGNSPGATLASLTAGYSTAHEQWFSPFLARHPYILENWLVNAILRHRFPFGQQSQAGTDTASAVEQFDGLAANFALMRGLLTSVAGHYREQFAASHVVHTVQASSKHFEHHPDFLVKARALLQETGLNDARGTAILLHEASENKPTATLPLTQDLPLALGRKPVQSEGTARNLS
jgi:lysine-N-methylase